MNNVEQTIGGLQSQLDKLNHMRDAVMSLYYALPADSNDAPQHIADVRAKIADSIDRGIYETWYQTSVDATTHAIRNDMLEAAFTVLVSNATRTVDDYISVVTAVDFVDASTRTRVQFMLIDVSTILRRAITVLTDEL